MADRHELAILAEREEFIREALSRPGGVTHAEPGHYIAYFSRAELQEELHAIADEARKIRLRQRTRPTPAAATEGRTRGTGHPAPATERNHPVKNILGAAVVVADIVFGMALPSALKDLHKQAHPHYTGVIALYGFLALATVAVIVALVRALGAHPATAPATNPGLTSFRRPR